MKNSGLQAKIQDLTKISDHVKDDLYSPHMIDQEHQKSVSTSEF